MGMFDGSGGKFDFNNYVDYKVYKSVSGKKSSLGGGSNNKQPNNKKDDDDKEPKFTAN